MTFWTQLNNKRKTWAPVALQLNSFTTPYPILLSKGLALRQLELPVRDFIKQGLDQSDTNKLGKEAVDTLLHNMNDEQRHDMSLDRCARSLTNYMDIFEEEAEHITKQWLEAPGNPITKAAVLENGVFFVLLPLFNLYGFQPLRETSQWISGDEILHVQSHRKAAQLLGARPNKIIDNLRRDTVAWLVSELEDEVKGDTKDRWIKSSDTLMKRGVSSFLDTQFASQPAFFETSNAGFAKYA